MTFDDPVLYEALTQWPAYADLVDRYGTSPKRARDYDPGDLAHLARIISNRKAQAAHYLVGRAVTDDLSEAYGLVDELVLIMGFGRRPRYGMELGLTAGDFGVEDGVA